MDVGQYFAYERYFNTIIGPWDLSRIVDNGRLYILTEYNVFWLGPARSGSVQLGPARSVSVWPGPARSGPVRLGPARSGPVWLGPARIGLDESVKDLQIGLLCGHGWV